MHGAALALGLLSLAVLLPGTAADADSRGRSVKTVKNVKNPKTVKKAVSPPRGQHRAWGLGHGFDTCAAPPLATMRAWREAYTIANIYIGGAARSCDQPHLTRGWIRAVRQMGYRLIPTYVGPQAPCTRFRARFTAENAAVRGAYAAELAVERAQRLGIPERQPIYYDMEAYNGRNPSCRRAVLTFLDVWSERLAELGYMSGVYSSAASGIRDLARADWITRPHAIWYARWDKDPELYDEPHVPGHLWKRHQRIKQYRGGHVEEHGGIKMHVDSNYVDGPVY